MQDHYFPADCLGASVWRALGSASIPPGVFHPIGSIRNRTIVTEEIFPGCIVLADDWVGGPAAMAFAANRSPRVGAAPRVTCAYEAHEQRALCKGSRSISACDRLATPAIPYQRVMKKRRCACGFARRADHISLASNSFRNTTVITAH